MHVNCEEQTEVCYYAIPLTLNPERIDVHRRVVDSNTEFTSVTGQRTHQATAVNLHRRIF